MKKNMEEHLKKMKVEKKLKTAFGYILGAFIVAIMVAIIGMVIMGVNFRNFYSKPYHNNVTQMEIRKDIQLVGKSVLWAITSEDEAKSREYINQALDCGSRITENMESLSKTFSDKEILETLQGQIDQLKTIRNQLTLFVNNGEKERALELFNQNYSKATLAVEKTLIQVGDYSNKEAKSSFAGVMVAAIIVTIGMLGVGIVCVLISIYLRKILTRAFNEPIEQVEMAAEKLKNGELDIEITYESEDEFGQLIQTFKSASDTLHDIIQDAGYLLGEMAEGNFDIRTRIEEKYVGDFHNLILSMRKLNRQLDNTLKHINEASVQVEAGSMQLAESAQALAEGATDQAGAVQELTATIENVTSLAVESAEGSQNAYHMIVKSEEHAQKSQEDLKQLIVAMQRINDTSKEIQNIIVDIEDIAAQTNLLSLNASIEAARAGEAGRGFAVVADQIGKLASDSAQSAVNTKELLQKSLIEVQHGNEITDKTVAVLKEILDSMENFAKAARESSEASQSQAEMLKQIELGIEQISSVVESNSASAEETSATSEELSAQSISLKELVERFTLRNDDGDYGTSYGEIAATEYEEAQFGEDNETQL